MKFFDRGSDIVVSTKRIEESVSKQEFQAAESEGDLKIYGQAGGVQVYKFSDVLEPVEPDIDTLVDTLNTWSQISIHQKLTTDRRLALPNPTEGTRIYDTTLHIPMYFDGFQWKSSAAGENTGAVFFNAPITPPILTVAVVDNFNPVGIQDSNMIRVESTNGPGTQITGMQAPTSEPQFKNQIILFINIGSKKITIMDNNPGSVPNNRYDIGANYTLNQNQSVAFVYDRDILRYIIWATNN